MKSTKKIKLGQLFQNVEINTQTGNYVPVASDVLKLVEMNSPTPVTVTINPNVFKAEDQLLVSQYGAGEVSFVAGSGMTILSDTNKLKISARYTFGTLIFRSATVVYLSGALKA